MKAARFYGPHKPLVIEDVPKPKPGYGEVLVRVEAAGVCHTELHFLDGVLDLGVHPITLGHEIAGIVEEVG
ncbi:MAG: alcohol dehydrogenase catalytic domain-containing protein, partial [Ignisphaera sp.]